MRGLLALALLGLLLASAIPASAADPVCVDDQPVRGCAGDVDNYHGCPQVGSFESEFTGVFLVGPGVSFFAGGVHECSRIVCFPEFGCVRSERRYVAVVAGTPAGAAFVMWTSAGSTCTTTVGAFVASHSTGCPAGHPPALPWGHVLP